MSELHDDSSNEQLPDDDQEGFTEADAGSTAEVSLDYDQKLANYSSAVERVFSGVPDELGELLLSPLRMGDIDVNPGLIPILGVTKSGKTRLVEALAAKYKTPLHVVGEPIAPKHPRSPTIERILSHSYDHLIESVMRARALSEDPRDNRLVLVDSFREFIWTIEGPAGPRGLPAQLGLRLTRLNNMFARMGAVVMVVINPSFKDEEFQQRLDSIASESTSGFIRIEGWSDEGVPLLKAEMRPERVPRNTLLGLFEVRRRSPVDRRSNSDSPVPEQYYSFINQI